MIHKEYWDMLRGNKGVLHVLVPCFAHSYTKISLYNYIRKQTNQFNIQFEGTMYNILNFMN